MLIIYANMELSEIPPLKEIMESIENINTLKICFNVRLRDRFSFNLTHEESKLLGFGTTLRCRSIQQKQYVHMSHLVRHAISRVQLQGKGFDVKDRHA